MMKCGLHIVAIFLGILTVIPAYAGTRLCTYRLASPIRAQDLNDWLPSDAPRFPKIICAPEIDNIDADGPKSSVLWQAVRFASLGVDKALEEAGYKIESHAEGLVVDYFTMRTEYPGVLKELYKKERCGHLPTAIQICATVKETQPVHHVAKSKVEDVPRQVVKKKTMTKSAARRITPMPRSHALPKDAGATGNSAQ